MAERLQKILARAGIASRRHAERLITDGRVRVGGRVVSELGTKADMDVDVIELDGKRIIAEPLIYIVLHKPRGVVATMSDPEGRPTVAELLTEAGARVVPVGRLDFATSGVLFATNDGDFAHGLLHPRKVVPKTYVLKVEGIMKERDLERWRTGVDLEDGKTLPAEVTLLRHDGEKTWITVTLTEGRNQQLRRMGEATRFRVLRLARTAFAGIDSEGLRPGTWRYLDQKELAVLKREYGVPARVVSPPRKVGPPTRPSRHDARRHGGFQRGSNASYGDDDRGRARSETRTTGTGGGPKAGEGDYRISSTRRRRDHGR